MARGKYKSLRQGPDYNEDEGYEDAEYEEEGAWDEDADAEADEDSDTEADEDETATVNTDEAAYADESDEDAEAEYDESGEAEGEYDAENEEGEYEDDEEGEYDAEGDAEAGYDEDEYYEDDDEPGADEAPEPYKPPTATSALKQIFFPRSSGQRPKAQPATGTAEDAAQVNLVNPRERLMGFFFGGALVILGIVIYLVNKHYVDTKNLKLQHEIRVEAPWLLLILGVIGIIVVLATLSKRRAALGFAMLFAGLAALQAIPIVGLVYLGTGLWLIFRSMRRRQPAGRGGSRGNAAAGRSSRAAAGTSSRAASGTSSSTSASTRTSTTTTGTASAPRTIGKNRRLEGSSDKSTTPASKRYTPPKPVKKPPPQPQATPEPTNRLSAWLRK